RLNRTAACVSCGQCDRACPWGIDVSQVDTVRSGECTLCLECTRVCPVPGALELTAARTGPVRAVLIPLLIVGLTGAGLYGSRLVRIPSAEQVYTDKKPGTESVRSVFIIDGVTCRDTAITAMGTLSSLDGVYQAKAYASHNRIDVLYDPQTVTPLTVASAFENPVFMKETGEFIFNLYRVLEIDGESVNPDQMEQPE
ncbi:4Fe-4S dicluster domain-containing protein, partial [bacterium]|nr:4Fe-4S dicluster domain-containing protein [candidate division CSSED10-310 bacterium]